MPYGACPDVDLRWCPGVQEFTHHSVWNNDVLIETWQQLHRPNKDQVVQRRGVGHR